MFNIQHAVMKHAIPETDSKCCFEESPQQKNNKGIYNIHGYIEELLENNCELGMSV